MRRCGRRGKSSRFLRTIEDQRAIAISPPRRQEQIVRHRAFEEKSSLILNPYLLLTLTASFTLLSFKGLGLGVVGRDRVGGAGLALSSWRGSGGR